MSRRIRLLGASAAALTCLVLAGVANADPTSYSGTVRNGGCDSARTVSLSGPSRIDVEVSSTSAVNSAYAAIEGPGGNVVSTGTYDTPAGGTYAVRVCTWYSQVDPTTLQYTAIFATGPAGQPALPRQQAGGVLGATTTLSRDVHGTGAIRTHSGLAWFTVKLDRNGAATVRVFDPRLHKHSLFTGASVVFGTSTVRITNGSMQLTLVQRAGSERIAFRSAHFRASGKVVRGGYLIV